MYTQFFLFPNCIRVESPMMRLRLHECGLHMNLEDWLLESLV